MILKGEEFSKRLESFSQSTALLMSKAFETSAEAAMKVLEMAPDSEVSEEQLVEMLKRLLSKKDS